jgi:hypothetical protein
MEFLTRAFWPEDLIAVACCTNGERAVDTVANCKSNETALA